jgi:hypothetical protein
MAVDIIARALAAGLMGADGNVSPDKLPKINTDETTKYSVGGIGAGVDLKGHNIIDVMMAMLYGVIYPTIEEPSFEIKVENKNGSAGAPFTTNGTLIFNRGKIEPAYGTSGYRAGLPTSYTYNGITVETQELTIPVTITVDHLKEGENEIMFEVNYSAGEQPMDSAGNAYQTALEAGKISKSIIINGKMPIYIICEDGTWAAVPIETSYFNKVEEGGGEGYQVVMLPEVSDGETQKIAVDSSIEIVGVQVFDELSQTWKWLGSEDATASMEIFKKGETIIEIVDGNNISYTIYQSDPNSEYHPVGERKLRFFIVLPA